MDKQKTSLKLEEVVKKYHENPILTAKDVPWSTSSIFNAGAIKFDGKYILLARIQALDTSSELVIAESDDGAHFKVRETTVISPDRAVNRKGIEDPRITKINGTFYIPHTVYSEYGPGVGLTTTENFKKFKRRGLIHYPGTKNPVLHPELVDGNYLLFHRPMADQNIWVSSSRDLEYWKTSSEPVLPSVGRRRKHWFETRVGSGAVPIRTDEGWLHIIHGVQGNVYRLGVAIFELDKPTKLIRISRNFILSPQENYERLGDVNNVVFTCGAIPEDDGTVKIYYGAADTCIALATTKISDLVDIALNH